MQRLSVAALQRSSVAALWTKRKLCVRFIWAKATKRIACGFNKIVFLCQITQISTLETCSFTNIFALEEHFKIHRIATLFHHKLLTTTLL